MDPGFRRGDTGKSSTAGDPFHPLWVDAVGGNFAVNLSSPGYPLFMGLRAGAVKGSKMWYPRRP